MLSVLVVTVEENCPEEEWCSAHAKEYDCISACHSVTGRDSLSKKYLFIKKVFLSGRWTDVKEYDCIGACHSVTGRDSLSKKY